MAHIWMRAEERANEKRTGLTPQGAADLANAGHRVSVEDSDQRSIPIEAYKNVGCEIVPKSSWRNAPLDAIIFGLKELPADGSPLVHRHIMFGHAYKGQPDGPALLSRFTNGGGTLLDLEYLTDETGRRKAAFGYWAGFAGAAVALKAFAAAVNGETCPPVDTYDSATDMINDVTADLAGAAPSVIVIGALGRVGTGARDLCTRAGATTTDWDMAETASGGPFPEILEHDVFLNCILAGPGCPVFVPTDTPEKKRYLTTIGDIACDPGSEYNPVPVYDRVTSWEEPVIRVHDNPILDVMAIDNLPSLLPRESSEDFAGQLLPLLVDIDKDPEGVWQRATQTFAEHAAKVKG